MLGDWVSGLVVAATLVALGPNAAEGSSDSADTQMWPDEAHALAYRQRGADGAWALPRGDAVLLDEAWWSPLAPLAPVESPQLELAPDLLGRIRGERLTAWSLGDVTLDGSDDLVISFRRPFERNFINMTRPRSAWVDGDGLSAHLGLYRPGDLSEIWVAGTLVSPVTAVAACDGGLAVAYGEFDRPGPTETGAWRWIVFGFLPVEPLPGPGTPTCVDIDGDGRTEPAVIGRSEP